MQPNGASLACLRSTCEWLMFDEGTFLVDNRVNIHDAEFCFAQHQNLNYKPNESTGLSPANLRRTIQSTRDHPGEILSGRLWTYKSPEMSNVRNSMPRIPALQSSSNYIRPETILRLARRTERKPPVQTACSSGHPAIIWSLKLPAKVLSG